MVICYCGKYLKKMRNGHYLSRQHLEDTGQPFFKRKLKPCDECGKMLYSVTKTHLKSEFHKSGGKKKTGKIYLVASDNDKNFVPTFGGVPYK